MIKLHEKNNGNNINILDKKECTGCSVCAQVCPHNCIKMIETKEGFHYPVIDEKLCTDCGLCVKKCHALNDNFKTDFNQEFYDVRANDEIRMKSSSGGMFTLIADYVFENNGFVCGASWRKDWLGVEHIIIDDKKDLDKLRYSKYMESSLGNIFSEIKKLLNDKKLVLFSGTPCQVSALNFYLGRDYENLITVDFLCNSVVPQKVWRKYLFEKIKDTNEIEYISFRDKNIFGCVCVGLYIKFADGEEYLQKDNDIYMKAFLNHTSVKEECLHCKYRRFERVGDITIGDYWSMVAKEKEDKGISLVKISSAKGSEVFEQIKRFCRHKKVNIIHDGFGNFITPIFTSRKYFFDNLDKEDFETLYKNCSNTKYNIGIVNMMFTNNAGGVMTYYALYKLIESLGYNPILIYNKFVSKNLYDNTMGCKTALKYCNVGNSVYSKEVLNKYNKLCNTFIVGSDQIWNYPHLIFYSLLDFATNDKKKIAFSTSYRKINLDFDKNIKFKYYIKQFDNVLLREDAYINTLKNEFDIEAKQVLDPVFLIDNYDDLINNSNLNIDYEFILVYCVYFENNILELLDYISNTMNIKIVKIQAINGCREDLEYSAEDFLYYMKNCKYLITDSYHGFCFGLIFNKNIIISLNNRANYRILSLTKLFNIQNRIVGSYKDLEDRNLLFENMDYDKINKKLDIEKKKSIEFLKKCLETKKIVKEDGYKDDLINLLINENTDLNNKINDLNKNIWKLSEINNKIINTLAWWIPIRKWRDNFRNKFKI